MLTFATRSEKSAKSASSRQRKPRSILGSRPDSGIFLTLSQLKVRNWASVYALAYHLVCGLTLSRDASAEDELGPFGVDGLNGSETTTGVTGVLDRGGAPTSGGVRGRRLWRFRSAVGPRHPPEQLVGEAEDPLPSERSSTSTTSRVYGTVSGDSRLIGLARSTMTPSSASSEAEHDGAAAGGISSGRAGRVRCGSR